MSTTDPDRLDLSARRTATGEPGDEAQLHGPHHSALERQAGRGSGPALRSACRPEFAQVASFTSQVDSWIGLGGTLAAALLAFMFGRVNLSRANEHEQAEALRRERIGSFATFCAAVVEYRRSQLHRWYVGNDHGGDARSVEERRPDVAQALRDSRAAAWSSYYRLLMVCDDDALAEHAKSTLKLTKRMKEAQTAGALNTLSDEVHDSVEAFAMRARSTTMPQGK